MYRIVPGIQILFLNKKCQFPNPFLSRVPLFFSIKETLAFFILFSIVSSMGEDKKRTSDQEIESKWFLSNWELNLPLNLFALWTRNVGPSPLWNTSVVRRKSQRCILKSLVVIETMKTVKSQYGGCFCACLERLTAIKDVRKSLKSQKRAFWTTKALKDGQWRRCRKYQTARTGYNCRGSMQKSGKRTYI